MAFQILNIFIVLKTCKIINKIQADHKYKTITQKVGKNWKKKLCSVGEQSISVEYTLF